ncbi:MAG TPA: DUF1587 domain-containing protein, partial [Polyangiaceae bacterium]|nr:DUF1587 domain-containing protein [Polyangiaceae bacterium]
MRSHQAAVTLASVVLVAACTGEVSTGGGMPQGTSAGSASGTGTPTTTTTSTDGGVATGNSTGGMPSTSGTTGGEPGVHSRAGLAARLSKVEYRNSVLDVLGVSLLPEELDAAAGGIPDDTGDGVFKHLADNQTSVEQHALAYFQVAEALTARVDLPALATGLGVCTEATAACGTAFVEQVGRKLFRRPLDQREVDAML